MASTCNFAELNYILWILLMQSANSSNGLRTPSFISTWAHMNRTFVNINWIHGLGEVPVYADIQVRSTSGYIYPGVGSGFVDDDDDSSGIRGGVVFLYSDNEVEIRIASLKSIGYTAYLVFTGQVGYNSENAERHEAGDVRVRLWRKSDFPPPSYTVPEFDVSAWHTSSISHPLGVVPVFTIVQLALTGIDRSGWYSHAQGTDTRRPFGTESGGGTIYGVSSTNVRLWTLSKVFSFCDGWGTYLGPGTACHSTSARVTIQMWTCLESDTIFSISVPQSIYSNNDTSSHQLNITSPFNHDEDFIIVRAESTAGSLPGYYFDGTGAAMADTTSVNSGYKLGGLVYATNNSTQTLRMWHPVFATSNVRCIALVATSSICVTGANIHVVIYRGTNETYTPVLSNAHVVTHRACYYEFACDDPYIHSAGDLILTLVGGSWSGTPPTCVYCHTVDGGINAIVDLKGNIHANISYACATGHMLVSGDLYRLCVETSPNVSEWTGTPPNCQPTSSVVTTTVGGPTSPVASISTTKPVQTICKNVTDSTPESIQDAIEMAEEISKNLTIEAKATGAFKRSLVCAQDTRASAKFVGMIGYVVFGIVLGFILLLDGLNVVQYCVDSRKTDQQ